VSALAEIGDTAVETYRPGLSGLDNIKLGAAIHSWSISAGQSCPGATPACLSVCYAMRGRLRMPNVANLYLRNWLFSQTDEFVPWMLAALRTSCVRTLRVHCAGDLYDAEYTEKWTEIVSAARTTRFFLYTRSWAVPEMGRAIRKLAKQPNMQLWLSEDVDTGPAPRWNHTRFAWMARNDEEAAMAPARTHLIFRDKPRTTMKHSPVGVQVCANEIHVPDAPRITCSSCGICFNKPRK